MPRLSPPTLTHSEQRAIPRATACNPRDRLIYSLALGTALRLAEIVGLEVGDVYIDDRTPRTRLRVRPKTAKGGNSRLPRWRHCCEIAQSPGECIQSSDIEYCVALSFLGSQLRAFSSTMGSAADDRSAIRARSR